MESGVYTQYIDYDPTVFVCFCGGNLAIWDGENPFVINKDGTIEWVEGQYMKWLGIGINREVCMDGDVVFLKCLECGERYFTPSRYVPHLIQATETGIE